MKFCALICVVEKCQRALLGSNFVSIPLSAHTNEIQDAPKRVRPSIVTKALQVDTPLNKTKGSQTPAKSTKTKIAKK